MGFERACNLSVALAGLRQVQAMEALPATDCSSRSLRKFTERQVIPSAFVREAQELRRHHLISD